MIFGRRTLTVHGKLLEGGLGRKQKKERRGSVSLRLRKGGCREKTREEEEGGRAGGREQKVRTFWQRRHRSLEGS